jgi:hypothetical protein
MPDPGFPLASAFARCLENPLLPARGYPPRISGHGGHPQRRRQLLPVSDRSRLDCGGCGYRKSRAERILPLVGVRPEEVRMVFLTHTIMTMPEGSAISRRPACLPMSENKPFRNGTQPAGAGSIIPRIVRTVEYIDEATTGLPVVPVPLPATRPGTAAIWWAGGISVRGMHSRWFGTGCAPFSPYWPRTGMPPGRRTPRRGAGTGQDHLHGPFGLRPGRAAPFSGVSLSGRTGRAG